MAVRFVTKTCRSCVSFGDFHQIVRGLHRCVYLGKNIQFNLSDIGEGIREVTVKSWHVNVNDKVAQFDNICEVESDKATVNITSRYDGVVRKLYYNIDDVALVGRPLIDIEVEGEDDEINEEKNIIPIIKEESPPPPRPEDIAEKKISDENNQKIKEHVRVPAMKPVTKYQTIEEPKMWNKSLATPAVRRIAMENEIKLNEVRPTGKNGRVLKEDILSFLHNKSLVKEERGEITTEKIRGITRIMFITMTKANSVPCFGYSDDIDVSKLVELRKRINELTDFKITYLPFVMKAFSKCLEKYPILNSSVDEGGENILYKSFHNIGMAVDTPSGLLVPNVKNVQSLSLVEISNEVKRLQESGLRGTLCPEDLKGGTISISNIGAIGGIQGIPVILPPEVAIAAIGRIQTLPRFDANGQVVAARVLNITMSADHRIIDGATVSKFVNSVKKYLENPELLIVEL